MKSALTRSVHLRLSAMMALLYFALGLWLVTFGTYATHALGFSGWQTGLTMATMPLAALFAPAAVGLLADRVFASERLMAALAFGSAATMWLLAGVESFGAVAAVLLLHSACFLPTISLSSSLALSHMDWPERQFPAVRVWGTIGWIAAGLLVGVVRLRPGAAWWTAGWVGGPLPGDAAGIEATALPLYAAALSLVVYGLFCPLLPHTPPPGAGGPREPLGRRFAQAMGVDALRLVGRRSFVVVLVVGFVLSIPVQFYNVFGNTYLNAVGLGSAAAKMTLGQTVEIAVMFLLPVAVPRFGVKRVMLVGIGAWSARFLLFAGEAPALLYASILLHGVAFPCFHIPAQIYLDRLAPPHLRGQVQGLMTVVVMGLGALTGRVLCGPVLDAFELPGSTTARPLYAWPAFWTVAGTMAALAAAGFLWQFQAQPSRHQAPA